MEFRALGIAVVAAVCFGTASVVQAAAVQRGGGPQAGRPARQVAAHPLFLLGVGLDVAALVLAAAALRSLPLSLVQATLALDVAVTALVAVPVLSQPLGRHEKIAIVAGVAGLVLLARSAPPAGAVPSGVPLSVLLVAGIPALLLAARAVRPAPRAVPAVALGVLAGVGFAGFALACRVLPSASADELLRSPTAWCAAGYSLAGLLVFARGLQCGSVTTVATACAVTEILLPAALGAGLLSETPQPGQLTAALSGYTLALAAVVALLAAPPRAAATAVPKRRRPRDLRGLVQKPGGSAPPTDQRGGSPAARRRDRAVVRQLRAQEHGSHGKASGRVLGRHSGQDPRAQARSVVEEKT